MTKFVASLGSSKLITVKVGIVSSVVYNYGYFQIMVIIIQCSDPTHNNDCMLYILWVHFRF